MVFSWYSLIKILRQRFLCSKSERCLGLERFVDNHFFSRNLVINRVTPYLCLLHFSPNTSSSSSSPTDRGNWPQELDSDDQDKQSYNRKMKRSRSCLSKSKRRRSSGTHTVGTQDVNEFTDLNTGHTKGSCIHQDLRKDSLEGHSWARTDEKDYCSCSESDHNLPACRRSVEECPYTAGSPISIPGRKAKRRKRWNSNSDSSSESKHMSVHELSSDEMSDLEPEFIPNLTNDSLELTDEEQFKNVILQFSESCLEEEVNKS